MAEVEALAAPPVLGSAFTVTVPSPTPPTNIASVACGTPPTYTATYLNPHAPLLSGQVTFSDDAVLFASAGTPGSLTAIATPVGGSGPVAEATGTVVVVTAPGSVAAAPTQMISVMGSFTANPNASHPSSLPQIQYINPSSTPAGGGTVPLTVFGHGFNSGSVIKVNGVAQTTVFVNSNTLTVAAVTKKATAGNWNVAVTTDAVDSSNVVWTFT